MDNSLQSKGPTRNGFVCMIHEKYHKFLILFAYKLCAQFDCDPSLADDLLQDFYQKLLDNHEYIAEKFKGDNVSYLFRMIQNRMLDIKRKKSSTNNQDETFTNAQPQIGSIHSLCSEMYYDNFFQTLDKILSKPDSELMKLYIKGHSYKEIGEMLSLNPSTVGVKIYRAKKILITHLD